MIKRTIFCADEAGKQSTENKENTMKNMTIEILKDKDIKEYSKLMVKVMEEFNQEDINDFQYWFTSEKGIIHRRESDYSSDKLGTVQFAAKYNGEIIGALEVESKNHIQSFFIKKEYQKKGIGRKLFDHSISYFRKKGTRISFYTVLSSTYAVNFYKTLGFKGEGQYLTFDNKSLPFGLADVIYGSVKKIKETTYSFRSLINRNKNKPKFVLVHNQGL